MTGSSVDSVEELEKQDRSNRVTCILCHHEVDKRKKQQKVAAPTAVRFDSKDVGMMGEKKSVRTLDRRRREEKRKWESRVERRKEDCK